MTTILLTQDYFFWSKVEGTAKPLAVSVTLAKNLAEAEQVIAAGDVTQVLIDLRHPEYLPLIQTCTQNQIRTLGFISHMDGETIAAARVAGCSTVMPKSQFSAQLSQILAG
jgi:hypothetical protein